MAALERLVGGLLCVGVPGPDPDEPLLERLRALAPGGIVLFARNVTTIEATRALVARLQATLGDEPSLSICVDQEGGRVARLPADVPLPSMLALGAADDAGLAERAGAALASTLRAIGANVDFAPVLDLALESKSTVVGTRSLGDDPERVAELGAALVRGLARGGVAATPKHFPGHGGTADDSHVSLPVVSASGATLRTRDWVPFCRAFAAGAPAVMTAHVMVPELDAVYPATLSRRVLHGVLREELGFTGVCFTDCLQMDAVAARFGSARAAVLAVAAGADALLVSHDLRVAEEIRNAVVLAVRDGSLSHARVEEAASRVAAFRAGHRLRAARGSDAPGDASAVAREIAERAIVVVRGELALGRERPITIVSFEGATGDGVAGTDAQRPSLNLALRRERARSELMRVPLDAAPDMLETLLDVVHGQSGRALVILSRRAHAHPAQRDAIRALVSAVPRSIVVSMLEPFDVACLQGASNVACCFGDEVTNVEALAKVLCGDVRATGHAPVRVPLAPA